MFVLEPKSVPKGLGPITYIENSTAASAVDYIKISIPNSDSNLSNLAFNDDSELFPKDFIPGFNPLQNTLN